METIGKLIGNNKAELEWSGQGYIYKNFEAFLNKTDEICYIPEYGVDEDGNIELSYTYKDFIELAKGIETDEFTLEQITISIFETVDWQSVETLLNEYD